MVWLLYRKMLQEAINRVYGIYDCIAILNPERRCLLGGNHATGVPLGQEHWLRLNHSAASRLACSRTSP